MKLLLIVLLGIFSPLQEDETFSINGSCSVYEEGTLYIFLVDEEQFKVPLTGVKEIVVEVSDVKSNGKKINYRFKKVPKGKYGIRCFLDTNGNKKLDKGMFGPSEPWGMSWKKEKPSGYPKFNDISFTVATNIENKNIQIK
jgi:uncharacterized protein (DUF2141 family)